MVFNTIIQGCKSNIFSKRPGTRSPYILTQVFTLIMAQVQLEHIQLV